MHVVRHLILCVLPMSPSVFYKVHPICIAAHPAQQKHPEPSILTARRDNAHSPVRTVTDARPCTKFTASGQGQTVNLGTSVKGHE